MAERNQRTAEGTRDAKRTASPSDPSSNDYRRLFVFAPDAHVLTTADGRILDANHQAAHLVGMPRSRLRQLSLDSLLPRAQRAPLRERMARLVDGDVFGEWDVTVLPVGRDAVTAAVSASVVQGADEPHLLWVLRDVTAVRAAHASLQSAYADAREQAEELRAIDQWRDAFLEAGAHDLRTPMAAIRAFAETLLERGPELTEEQHHRFLRRIVQTTDRMARLLEDLLELDRGTRGAVEPHYASTDVSTLVHQAVAEVDTDDHLVLVDVPDDLVMEVDPVHVGKAITHLVENAVIHTPRDSTIRVQASVTPAGAQVVVEDDGPGVPEDVAEHMFLPFVSHQVTSAAPAGAGLGLSLVRLVAELHGGKVVHEPRDGDGARFVMDLPRRPPGS